MQKLKPAIAVLLLLSLHASARSKDRERLILSNRVAAKLTIGPMLPVGVEYYFHNTWGILLEAGIPLHIDLVGEHASSSAFKKMRYNYRIRTELRKYFITRRRSRFFIGIEHYYHEKKYTLINSDLTDGTYWAFVSRADLLRSHNNIGMHFGMSFLLSGRVYMEWHIGAAKDHFSADARNTENMSNWNGENLSPLPQLSDAYVGNYNFIRPSFGLKLSYLFNK